MNIRNHGARSVLGRFLGDRRGAVAHIVAISLLPLLIATGVGIDVSRVVSARSNLQDALDAAALALAQYPPGTAQTTLDTQATTWTTANLVNKDLENVQVAVNASRGTVVLTATATMPTIFAAIVKVDHVDVDATSTVKWGSKLEVALVLDNTGSMGDDNKLTYLISSAKALVTTLLQPNATVPNSVKISIVPFSNTVNVGATHRPDGWIDAKAMAYYKTASDIFSPNPDIVTTPGSTTPVDRFAVFDKLGKNWGGCVETRPQWVGGTKKDYDVTDVGFSDTSPGTRIVPFFSPDGSDSYYVYNKKKNRDDLQSNAYGNNYLSDKWKDQYGPELDRLRYSPKYASPTWKGGGDGPNAGCGIKPVQPLTTNSKTLTDLLGQMVASGNTNVPIGMFWGWMTVSPNGPFRDGAYLTPVDYGTDDVTKVVIVLTDGENTIDSGSYSGVGFPWQSLITEDGGHAGDATTAQALNDREAKICANMKQQNIVIYAVPLKISDKTDTGKAAKKLLLDCVTTPENYVDVSDPSKLSAAFQGIADSISKLRLAK